MKGQAAPYQPGSKIHFRWEIENPVRDGLCAIKISDNSKAVDSIFKVVTPIDTAVIKETGYFPCGQKDGVAEGVDIMIPFDSLCDDCTLQLNYKTNDFGEISQ